MAGVDNIPTAKEIKRMRQRKDIDYNKDIPFKREVPEFIGKLEESEAQQNAFFASTISLQTL
jgi:MinD superfamily P-loop ATPase